MENQEVSFSALPSAHASNGGQQMSVVGLVTFKA